MPYQNGVEPASNTSDDTPAKSALESALAQIETVKVDLRNVTSSLNKLVDQIKAAGREQKANDKEIQSVRQTLRSLQSVRI